MQAARSASIHPKCTMPVRAMPCSVSISFTFWPSAIRANRALSFPAEIMQEDAEHGDEDEQEHDDDPATRHRLIRRRPRRTGRGLVRGRFVR